jgi:putative endopeptidase
LLAEIAALNDKAALVKKMGELFKMGEDMFFGGYVMADLMDSNSQVLYLAQGGLGIGDRDYYLKEENAAIKAGYRTYLERILSLAGVADSTAVAANALAVEDFLAQISWTREQERDVQAQYNPMTPEQLYAAYPGFDFASLFQAIGLPEMEKVIVSEPSFFQGFAEFFGKTDVAVLRDYLTAHIVSGACSALSDDFYDASFDFYSRQLSGIQEQKPRWKRAMQVPNNLLGEAVGQMYVARYFPESSKNKMMALVENLRAAWSEHIDSLDWMSDSTKVRAQEKLAAFTVKIGYPDKWKDYSTLEIDPSKSYYENLANASAWYVNDNLSRLGKPTDKSEWGMTPQTVNAYYNPTTNEICFSAAILQPPFFNPDADDPVNYGAIGVVIGHEMSHGFDDQGRHFDKDGNMVNWWTDEDAAKFEAKGAILVKQFDAVEILPGLNCNGTYTLGENIGDHGGLSIAYTAMRNAIAGKPERLIDGFTPDQRFYIAYASVWAGNITEEEMRRLTNIDPHSLSINRVNVSLKNFQTFFDAFDIKEGDAMFRPEEERVHIW